MKKRFSCFFLVFTLILSVVCVSMAEDEILFRGVPWCSDYDTVINALADGNFSWNDPVITLGKLTKYEIDGMSSNYDQNYQCIYTVNSDKKMTSLTVAGYKLNDVKLYFAFVPNANGKIDHKVENTSFYMAKYTIKPIDSEVASKDLKEKLTKLYGAPEYIESSNKCASGDSEYPRWNGKDGSFVVLTVQNTSYGEPDIYIYYGIDKGDDMIKLAENLQKQAEADDLKDAGTDGL